MKGLIIDLRQNRDHKRWKPIQSVGRQISTRVQAFTYVYCALLDMLHGECYKCTQSCITCCWTEFTSLVWCTLLTKKLITPGKKSKLGSTTGNIWLVLLITFTHKVCTSFSFWKISYGFYNQMFDGGPRCDGVISRNCNTFRRSNIEKEHLIHKYVQCACSYKLESTNQLTAKPKPITI